MMLYQSYKPYKLVLGIILLGMGGLELYQWRPRAAHGATDIHHVVLIKQERVAGCPPSVLEQSIIHPVQQGETLASIAESYGLLPSSILSLNPSLPSTTLTAGDRITIPPHNGTLHNIAPRTTWQALAETHGIRADVLFESNGCGVTPPLIVFIPGIGTRINPQTASSQLLEPEAFDRFPISQEAATVSLEYGWQQPSDREQPLFHSGMDWSAPVGTSVHSVGDGTVAFVGEKGDYGMLVVINHAQGLQTRYAQLSTTQVSVGEVVSSGTTIGLSGESGAAIRPHLHFEVRLNSNSGWVAQDPMLYLAP